MIASLEVYMSPYFTETVLCLRGYPAGNVVASHRRFGEGSRHRVRLCALEMPGGASCAINGEEVPLL